MEHEMRAEIHPGSSRVKIWHMVRKTGSVAMCGRELEAGSPTRSDEAWGSTEEPFCHSCGAMYLREVP
ncbi:hypothetical protein [Wenjunlia tyrosinilytica]|uniref:Uncharacterized protein n=1 Tax=Wenjunlia tyrosinilytica TaxID=1544741 RepID=A0A917ZMH8_9ACTN|nr:hypothetical protein [Wenjunlia tyrosinilytica]GGO87104.1 hypothetical protein GCM10012280_24820 [Wenjunlia tyrosinilytica]